MAPRTNFRAQLTKGVRTIITDDAASPAAPRDHESPVYGMPILDADKARHIIGMKRSMNPGFAGLENGLFDDSRMQILFGDARKSLLALIH